MNSKRFHNLGRLTATVVMCALFLFVGAGHETVHQLCQQDLCCGESTTQLRTVCEHGHTHKKPGDKKHKHHSGDCSICHFFSGLFFNYTAFNFQLSLVNSDPDYTTVVEQTLLLRTSTSENSRSPPALNIA